MLSSKECGVSINHDDQDYQVSCLVILAFGISVVPEAMVITIATVVARSLEASDHRDRGQYYKVCE
jgi:uncharacterized protein (DUF983 family)